MTRPEWAPEWATPEQIAAAEESAKYWTPSDAQREELARTARMLAGGDERLAAGIAAGFSRAWELGWRTGAAWADVPGGVHRTAWGQTGRGGSE